MAYITLPRQPAAAVVDDNDRLTYGRLINNIKIYNTHQNKNVNIRSSHYNHVWLNYNFNIGQNFRDFFRFFKFSGFTYCTIFAHSWIVLKLKHYCGYQNQDSNFTFQTETLKKRTQCYLWVLVILMKAFTFNHQNINGSFQSCQFYIGNKVELN